MENLVPRMGKRPLAVGPTDKLFLVTRADLIPGSQAVQAAHAFREFIEKHPEVDRAWYRQSNHLAFLATANMAELENLLEQARILGLPVAAFHEPDRGGELTAIAIGPGSKARRLVGALPLALV